MVESTLRANKVTRRKLLCLGSSTALASLTGCVFSDPIANDNTDVNKIVAPDGDSQDFFGFSLDIANDGQTLLVGSYRDSNPNGEMAGGAYVFRRNKESWYRETKLTANDGDEHDRFGYSVSLSSDGETAIVGTIADEDPNGTEAGAAYIYEKESREWHQRNKLSAPDGEAFDQFSRSLLLNPNGDTAYVGSPFREDSNGNTAGAIYEYSRESEGWKLVSRLVPENKHSIGSFGYAMDVSNGGERLFASGKIVPDTGGKTDTAAVNVFEKSGGEWVRQATLTASDRDRNDFFGETVTVSEDGQTVLVGASNDENPNGEHGGSVYLFENQDGEWHQAQKLTPADTGQRERFGLSLAMTSDPEAILIGAPGESSDTGEQSRICVFKRDEGHWQQDRVISAPENDPTDHFGTRVTVSEETGIAAVSAPEADGNKESTGAVYVFDCEESN
ncbi:Beta-propeller repeat containing protein [Halorhabdus sp. SVX81]|uniref:FG-GAP repeat protein n=1 Tax=Halorhabdus sp. SVX81 TaxID=2978283 RepID=UPI0023DB5A94|nr:FG-GAP repeat protein [Halorhabdus sp. SVX81]WEL16429.1 Beta-propeller repeat containing protein [Halorhabdus sp. SVX81]